jgi:signal transduction histidine kinase
MRLVDLIRENHEIIIRSWKEFARTLDPDGQFTDLTLRDHASAILDAIAIDMELPQSDQQRVLKAKGMGGPNSMDPVSVVHAKLRIGLGFRIDQIIAEYRALRASVLRLWAQKKLADPEVPDEVTRFNEAVDSAIAEILSRYSKLLEQFRDQSLMILGHDLRTPLTAITLFAQMLSTPQGIDDKTSRVASRIIVNAERINRMLGEFVDLSRTRFGVGLSITRGPVDLLGVCQHVLDDLRQHDPGCAFRFDAFGDLQGDWDGDRLAQLTTYLVRDAIQHSDGQPVRIVVRGQLEEVEIDVHHEGRIPPDAMGRVFEPFARAGGDDTHVGSAGTGLGLYLVQQIAISHGGSVEASSTSEGGTTFHVRLPRQRRGIHPGE